MVAIIDCGSGTSQKSFNAVCMGLILLLDSQCNFSTEQRQRLSSRRLHLKFPSLFQK